MTDNAHTLVRRGASRRRPLVDTAAAKPQVTSKSTGVLDIPGGAA